MTHPAYVSLLESGELGRRARTATDGLESCSVCPHACLVRRSEGELGRCQTGRWARVASYFAHPGEEDCLRGWRGSGTVFFCGCNLLCSFCQNWDTSHECRGTDVSPERLAAMMLELQEAGCHNINWVTPSHVVPQALEALALAAESGLRLPIVYNSGGYDSVESLALLDGVVDIYMPDFKCWDPDVSTRLMGIEEYPDVTRAAIREMHRQVGDLVMDDRGIASRGLLVRHLVLPGGWAGTPDIVQWLAREISQDTFLNIMGQYRPEGAILDGAPAPEDEVVRGLRRRLRPAELAEARRAAIAAGLRRLEA